MMIWRNRVTLSVLLAAFTITANNGMLAAESNRPNILFIFTDDQPQMCMGAMGNELIRTPNMDRLAAEGVVFTNAFVTTAICCSNRASILTGQHMRRHGIRDFHTPLSVEAFAQTYPALLRKAGYRTGYLGKFAVGAHQPEIRHLSLPADQFDFWFGFAQAINFRQEVAGQVRYLTTLNGGEGHRILADEPSGSSVLPDGGTERTPRAVELLRSGCARSVQRHPHPAASHLHAGAL
jgi:arylsulfatase A-like enzyme